MIQRKLTYLVIALLLLLSACSNEIRIGGDGDDPAVATLSYLRVSLRCPSPATGNGTRSTPTGGETGDGNETGQDNENRIANFLLLFYRASARSNAPAGTPIDKIMYFDRTTNPKDTTTLIAVDLPEGEYNLLVAANTGDLRPSFSGKTLGDIRDHLLTSAWTEDKGICSRFAMTSDGHTDDRVTLCGNPESNPADATVEVERLAARIDYRTTQTAYAVADPDYGNARVSILGAAILNKMKAGSYFLKRVAAANSDGKLTTSAPVEYLGDELPATGSPQQNYVVDPWSLRKTSIDASKLYDNYYTSFGDTPADWENVATSGTSAGNWLRLGYTQENTISREHQADAYCTTIVFRARYTPQGFSEGQTFYVCNGKLYASREEAAAEGATYRMPVHEYPGGICYYTWRVRHTNDGDDTRQGIMEYAIVRNNIYRLKISDVYRLGGEVPFPSIDPEPTPPDEPGPGPDPGPDPEPDPGPDPGPGPGPDPEPGNNGINIEASVETWTTMPGDNIYL